MAGIHNAIKYGTDIVRGFSRVIGLSEDEEGTVRLGETLTPIIDMWGRLPFAFHRAERACAGFTTRAADAGNFSLCQLMNPLGSRLLVEIEEIYILAAVLASFNIDHSATALATEQVAQKHVRDTRWPNVAPQAQLRNGIIAAITSLPVMQVRVNGGDTAIVKCGFVLKPGDSILVRGSGINLAINASFTWRERQLLPGELGT